MGRVPPCAATHASMAAETLASRRGRPAPRCSLHGKVCLMEPRTGMSVSGGLEVREEG